MTEFVTEKAEYMVRKQENVDHVRFILLQKCFPKPSPSRPYKTGLIW